ncbi:hypothetical protein ASF47_18330 [Nocardioides sp. Leaf285]|nr:hypothetical protein ASF47_18330 [Nocardioides sp. Leaf285]
MMRGIQIATPHWTVRHVRQARADLRAQVAQHVEDPGARIGPMAAEGAMAVHSVLSISEHFALCGAPVFTWGGNHADIDCHLCRALWPREVKDAVAADTARIEQALLARQRRYDDDEYDDDDPADEYDEDLDEYPADAATTKSED